MGSRIAPGRGGQETEEGTFLCSSHKVLRSSLASEARGEAVRQSSGDVLEEGSRALLMGLSHFTVYVLSPRGSP